MREEAVQVLVLGEQQNLIEDLFRSDWEKT
jgi:hypothetical protein